MYKKVVLCLMSLLVLALGILTLFNQKEILSFERRKAQDLGDFAPLDPAYWEDLDAYLSDHFIFRETALKINNLSKKYLFAFKDNDGVYTKQGYLFDILTYDEAAVDHLILKTNELANTYFKDQDCYFIAIPRKNDYSERYFPDDLSFDDIKKQLDDKLSLPMIAIADLLSLDSYYKTDIHWRQEALPKVAERIVESLGDTYHREDVKLQNAGTFYGALYARSFFDTAKDELYYVDLDLNGVKVFDLEKDAYVKVYDESAITSPDAYDLFLDGPSAYLKITNEKVNNGQKLIVFRDSFASSLLPLFINSYEEIEVLDLRYYSESLLDELELASDAKVLFIYGSEFINQSGALR